MNQKYLNFLQKLGTLSQGMLLGLALILIIILFLIDYLIKVDLSFSIFYLFPIILVTWFIDQNSGIIISIICSLTWLFADISVKQYPYRWLPYWNTGVRLGFFLIIVYLLSALKKAYEKEKILARTDNLTGAVNQRYFHNKKKHYYWQLT